MVISILMSHNIGLWLTRDEARRIAVNSSRAVGLSILKGGASVASAPSRAGALLVAGERSPVTHHSHH